LTPRHAALAIIAIGLGATALTIALNDQPTLAETTPRSAIGAAAVAPPPATAPPGDGFIVWESKRSGAFRLWTRNLDGSGLEMLSRAEDGARQHCCPHISPDGSQVAYVALPRKGGTRYLKTESGPLRLIDLRSGEERQLAPAARNYYENRAVVWLSDTSLAYIDGDGHTFRLEVATGARKRLTKEPLETNGWLIDPTLHWATSGYPTFSRFDAKTGGIAARRRLGGCQPYFTADGRYGIWTSGAGGPVKRIELATRTTQTIVRKNDPALPDGQSYVYFPMLSRSGSLLALGASPNQHDHFRSNYDIFVLEVDGDLTPVGRAHRLTDHPGIDRFPDVWERPLPLGRHTGEAPTRVHLEGPDGAAWSWQFGDDQSASGPSATHDYRRPGVYTVTARRDDRELRGRVVVRPAAAPRAIEARVRARTTLEVVFDEAVVPDGADLSLASGIAVTDLRQGDSERVLRATLAREPAAADALTVAGVADRAARPNRLASATLELPPPTWPADRRGLVYLWEANDRPNLVGDATDPLEAHGRATFDHHHAMVTSGGRFLAGQIKAGQITHALKSSNEMTIEATITPSDLRQRGPARIVSLSSGPRGRNFTLGQERDRLSLLLLVDGRKRDGRQATLGKVEAGRPQHVIVTYSPGSLTVYRDGEHVMTTPVLQGDFYNWKPRVLLFGSETDGSMPWRGTLSHVAIYDRVLDAAEARESSRRAIAARAARPVVARVTLRGRLRARSRVPTLTEIDPYVRGLVVFEYDVVRLIAGVETATRIRVAHWALLGGQPVAPSRFTDGSEHRLVLEPFEHNPQVQSDYISDTLDVDFDMPFYLDVGYPNPVAPAGKGRNRR